MSTPARIPLLLNPGGGSAPADPAAFASQLDPRLEPQTLRGDVCEQVRGVLATGADLVAVAGGDGTQRAAAAAILEHDAVLAIVPTGTLNHFARRVGIETVADAAAALQGGIVREYAVGTFGDSIFLNTLTIGEYARVLRVRERLRRYLRKWPAAGVGFLYALLRGNPIELTLELGDSTVTRRTTLVWIGLGQGSFPLVHEVPEQTTRPALEVAILRAGRLRAFTFGFRMFARVLRRELPVRDAAIEILHAERITLHAQHRIDATADGEVLRLAPPVEIAVRARGVRVLTPPPGSGDAGGGSAQ